MPLFKTAKWGSDPAADSVCKELLKESSKTSKKKSGKSKEEPLNSPIKKTLKYKDKLKNKLKKNTHLLSNLTQTTDLVNENKVKKIPKGKKVNETKSTNSGVQNSNNKSKKLGSNIAVKKINESKKTVSNKVVKQIKNEEITSQKSKKRKKGKQDNKSLKQTNLIIKKVKEIDKKSGNNKVQSQKNEKKIKKAVKSQTMQSKESESAHEEIKTEGTIKKKSKKNKKVKKLSVLTNISESIQKQSSPEPVVTKTSKIDSMKQKRLMKKEKLKQKLNQIAGGTEIDFKVKKKPKKDETLREKMLNKLKASKFRYLNEQLYTATSKEAKSIFEKEPNAFVSYHEGYQLQVEKWPLNPVDTIIKSIKKMPKSYVIADFGCGEAKLARSVQQKVHSFDLVAINEFVIECDIAHVPLEDESVDVVVFCLSLMGTNLTDYLLEANRVLKNDGMLKIAEIESRFDTVQDFIEGLKYYGFKKVWKDLSHNLFYFLDFKKEKSIKPKKNLPSITLNPCMYKKR